MLLIYQPVDGERREFPFRLHEMMSFDAEALEDVGGNAWDNYEDFAGRLAGGNFRARRALLWIMLKKENPKLRFSDLVVRFDELAFEAEDAEKVEARERLAADDLTDEERAALEALLEDEPPVGKGGSDDSATDGPSPAPDLDPLLSN